MMMTNQIPNLIAILGPKGSGKTTLSKHLKSQHNYTPTSFATPIKLMLETLLCYQDVNPHEINRMLYGDLKETSSKFLSENSPRYAMQTLGSEWRDLISRNLWVNIWENKIYSQLSRGKKISIDDVRFPHEAEAIKRLGGILIRISRPGHDPDPNHSSEVDFLKIIPNYIIHNNSTKEDMYYQIDRFLSEPV